MIRPEHPFDIRPDLRKAETTKAETTTAETVIRPKQLVRQSMNSGKIVKLSLQHIKLTHLLIRVIFIILNNKLCIYYIDRDFNFFFIIGGTS